MKTAHAPAKPRTRTTPGRCPLARHGGESRRAFAAAKWQSLEPDILTAIAAGGGELTATQMRKIGRDLLAAACKLAVDPGARIVRVRIGGRFFFADILGLAL